MPVEMDLSLETTDSDSVVRELSLADIEHVLVAPPAAPAIQSRKKMRDTHHMLAQAIAAGARHYEAAALTGYSQVTISILLNDPAFKELVEHYREVKAEKFATVQAKMAAFSHDILDELHERFEEEPKEMSSSFLKDLLTTFTDRTGNGPRTTQVNVNVDLAGRLEAARNRVKELAGTIAANAPAEAGPATDPPGLAGPMPLIEDYNEV